MHKIKLFTIKIKLTQYIILFMLIYVEKSIMIFLLENWYIIAV